MGLFSFIFGKKSNEPSFKEKVESMTISREGVWEHLGPHYEEAAWLVLSEVTPFSDDEKNKIIKKLVRYERKGDFEYLKNIYKTHFSKKEWHWEEYDFWREYRIEHGIQPPFFKFFYDPYKLLQQDDVFEYTTLPKIKKIMVEIGIQPPQKNVKKSIQTLINENTNLFNAIKNQVIDETKWKEFFIMQMHIHQKVENIEVIKNCKEWTSQGNKTSPDLRNVDKCDYPFIEIAKQRNPNIIPPYWPDAVMGFSYSV